MLAASSASRSELTKEISQALQNVNQQTIKKALKIAKTHAIGSSKVSAIHAFEDAVMRYGISELVAKMNRQLMKQTCKLLEIDNVRQKALADAIHRIGIVEFLANKCDVMLLKEYSRILGLADELNQAFWEKGSQEIEREIADEVMLQGAERFFRRMPTDLVKEFCRELGLELQGRIVDPVDKILCYIFDLEPLESFNVILEQRRKQLEEKKRKQQQQQSQNELIELDSDRDAEEQENSESSGVAERSLKERGEESAVGLPDTHNSNNSQQIESEIRSQQNGHHIHYGDNSERQLQKHRSNNKNRTTNRQSALIKEEHMEELSASAPHSDYEDKNEGDISVESGPDEDSVGELPRRRGKAKYKAPPLSNIKKGITAEELHNFYNVTDLQEWCKQNNLDYSGKKPVIIKRIIEYLRTGQRPLKKMFHKGKKRGESGGGSGVSTKQDSTTDDSAQGNNAIDFMDDSEVCIK